MSETRLRVRLLHSQRLYGQPYMSGAELELPVDIVRMLLRKKAAEMADLDNLKMLLALCTRC